ncbi:MAG: LPS export ABC transporter permease LptF [Proteobacteria bacterium]|nr:LPS export ABC transporter permease LptF [Pseudomonadota bacterium]
MDIFSRYVFRQLFVGLMLVSAGLTCIIWLSQSLRFVEMIVNRGLTAGAFIYMTLLLLPNFLTVILPIALFTVIVFTYSKMIADRELVVMRAAGVSQVGLARPAIALSLLTMIFAYFLNLYLLPESYRAFRVLQWEIRNTYSHVLLKEGAFNSVSSKITVYIRERSKDGQLLGILVHDERDKDEPVSLMAERGALVDTGKGARVVMYNGNRQSVAGGNKLSILYFDRYVFEVPTGEASIGDRFREPRERSMIELISMRHGDATPADYGKYKVELHKRLVAPVLGLAFSLIGLACLLFGPITRRSQTKRIVSAVVFMVAIQGASLGLENIVARNLYLAPILYLIAFAPCLTGIYFLVANPVRTRAKRKRRRVAASSA